MSSASLVVSGTGLFEELAAMAEAPDPLVEALDEDALDGGVPADRADI